LSLVATDQTVKLSQLTPRSGERAVFLGQTGSGKTWAMRAMLGAYLGRRQVIVLDTKHDPAWNRLKGARYVATLEGVTRARFPRCPLVIWRPSGEAANDPDVFDKFYAWLYARGSTVAVVDEVSQTVAGVTNYGSGFADVVTRGRVRGLIVFFGSQRPVMVPRIVYSESQRFYVFFVSDKRDRATIAAFSNPELSANVPHQHGFWYYHSKTRKARYFGGLDLA
jgi:energy-coupling factor transporter ATP-binding protein EcfA2